MKIGEDIWSIVKRWDHLKKDTIGKQLIRAADSVATNLAEGFGRYHYKDIRNFGYYSRGSLYETKTWLTKTYERKLISESEYSIFIEKINDLGVRLNNYINSVGSSQRKSEI